MQPNQSLALDEGTIPWRGNLSFRTYNKDKPVKFGLRLYKLCDCDTGYCLTYEMYTGKKDHSPKGATHDVVMRMLDGYTDEGHHIYVDSYYSSPTLFDDLYVRQTGACGTVRKNRKGMPTEIRGAGLPLRRGEMATFTRGALAAMKWRDRRDVHMLTTVHTTEMTATGRTDRGTGAAIMKPKPVVEYNKNMGAVDRNDQLHQYSAFQRKTAKWWKKAFFYFLDLTIVNSYILYKQRVPRLGETIMSQKIYRRTLVSELLLDRDTVRAPGRRFDPQPDNASRLTARHFPSKVPPTEKRKCPTRTCVVCSSKPGRFIAID